MHIRRHQERIANREDRCAIDHNAIEKFCGLFHQLGKRRSAQDLSRVGCAMTAGENIQLSAGSSAHFPAHRDRLTDHVDLLRRNWASGGFQLCTADEAIDKARSLHVVGICFPFVGQPENLVQTRAAKIAIQQKNAVSLLRQRDRVVGAGKTLPFVRHRTGKQGNLPFAFGAQQSERSSEVAKGFCRRTFRHIGNDAISRSAVRRSARPRRFGFFLRLRNRSKHWQAENRLGLIDRLDRTIDRIGAKNESESGREPAK